MKQGKFITVEGGEGAGKTTLIRALAQRFEEKGIAVLVTREPGGITIAEEIRSIILDTRHTTMDARTEALLYAAARRQHLVEKVLPAMQRGEIVICDRFVDSSLAYQGHARGLGMDAVWEINKFAIEAVMPDVTLWMDMEPEVGLNRINTADEREINRLDLEQLSFHERVRQGYKLLQLRFSERIHRIDANGTPEQVLEQTIEVVKQQFKGFNATNVKLL